MPVRAHARGAGTLLVLAALACAPRPPQGAAGPAPAAVLVEPLEATLRPGETVQLAAQANDAVGQPIGGAILTWRAADPARLRASETGLVTALGPAGPARVVVASGQRRAEAAITVLPGPPARLELAGGDHQTGRAGERLAAPVAARALDASGNPVPGARVVFAASANGKLAPPVATADAGGVASATWHLGPEPGAQRASASLELAPTAEVPYGATATPGPPARLVPAPRAAAPAAGEAPLEVRVVDAGGHGVGGVAVRWRALTRGAKVEPATAVTGPEGVATATLAGPPRGKSARVETRVEGVPPAVLEVPGRR